jgi:hypothetical protein
MRSGSAQIVLVIFIIFIRLEAILDFHSKRYLGSVSKEYCLNTQLPAVVSC